MSHPKIGFGEDIHRLIEGRKLILGTVEIPHSLGLLGHSDADVVLHALSDALLSAIGEPDIGFFFPDNDASIEGIDSKKILSFAVRKVKEAGYKVGNASISILAERPKLRPYIDKMKEGIAKILEVSPSDVGIAAGTNEGLDAVGEEKAIKATAITLLLPLID
ncbi:MAG: 2-C-methyl-D-erythritol 2,4-cyclodiphosphate synthase [Bacilli bacterium]|nr:2-C-methyl-D-erythritol 2,4-cyclodiphosphate synthase [Bacilli bacterium]